jgi:hypothetical protein
MRQSSSGAEDMEILCGKAHFAALEDDVELRVTNSWNKLTPTWAGARTEYSARGNA